MHRHAAAASGFKALILAAAQEFGLQPAVICGIGSRESGWGTLLTPPGPGGTGDAAPRKSRKPFRSGPMPPDGKGFARGLMQVDFDAFPFAQSGNWQDPQANIHFGCGVLHDNLRLIRSRTSLQGLMQLRAAIAAYNCGGGWVLKAIQQGKDVDAYTKKGNYSADVLNRAGFFQAQGWA